MDPSIPVQRNWWECTPRENFTVQASRHLKTPVCKDVRAELRYIEEWWAMNEQRAVGMKRTMVYR